MFLSNLELSSSFVEVLLQPGQVCLNSSQARRMCREDREILDDKELYIATIHDSDLLDFISYSIDSTWFTCTQVWENWTGALDGRGGRSHWGCSLGPSQSTARSHLVLNVFCIQKCKVVAVAWLILIRFEALSDYFTKLSDQPWSYGHIVAVTSMHHHEEG